MSFRSPKRLTPVAIILVAALCLLVLPAVAAADATPPDKHLIEDVPLYQQIQAVGCGAAASQMVLDYWGPFVDQKAVYDAARTLRGSSLPDLARAAQFSPLSHSAGDRFPSADGWGYPGRPLGYGGFYYASSSPWLDQLRAVVAQGYPVICLTDWLPGVYGPHYRVVVGYDHTEGVVILNDPWARELKGDMDYQGGANQKAAYDRKGQFAGWKWSYADFLSIWGLSTGNWGVPAANYGAVLIAPWRVSMDAPASVAAGDTFAVRITVAYPCPAPFGGAGFPSFPAVGAQVDLALPAGFSAAGGDTVALGTMSAGATQIKTVDVTAGAGAGSFTIGVTARGTVSGSLGVWRDFPAYAYQDLIGGSSTVTLRVTE